jgi:CubicO group peptidase (beta-lactamase class C family)
MAARSLIKMLLFPVFLLTVSCCSNRMVKPVRQNPSRVAVRPDPAYSALIAGLEEFIPEIMNQTGIPGLSIALIDSARIIWQGNFGFRDTGAGAVVDDSTVFVAASFSKPVFSYLVLKLVDQGKMDLDTPLIRYAPESYIEKAFKKIGDDRFYDITARMVLTHTTGFPDFRLFGGSVRIDSTPGTRFRYSGEAFHLLQKIVEYIEKKPLNALMRDEVFLPLGMENTSYVYENRFGDRVARGYGHWLGFIFNRKMRNNRNARADRSLLCTTGDFARFMTALITGEGLSDSTHSRMLQSQMRANSRQVYWGLGIGMEIADGDTIYWHDGEGMIFSNYFAFSKHNPGFVYFTNSSRGLSIGQAIFKRIDGGSHPSFQWLEKEQVDLHEGSGNE